MRQFRLNIYNIQDPSLNTIRELNKNQILKQIENQRFIEACRKHSKNNTQKHNLNLNPKY